MTGKIKKKGELQGKERAQGRVDRDKSRGGMPHQGFQDGLEGFAIGMATT